MWPSFLALLSRVGNKNVQGAIQGYGTSMGSIASMLGLVTGGILFEKLTTLVFIGGSIIFLLIAILLASKQLKKWLSQSLFLSAPPIPSKAKVK